MMQATIVFGLPGAGKSALARHLIHDLQAPPAAWFADDDRTLNFDATCLDLTRSDWAMRRMIWFRSGSCFVLNLDLCEQRIAELAAEGIEHIFVVCSGDPSLLYAKLAEVGSLQVNRAVLVLDAVRHLRDVREDRLDACADWATLMTRADSIVLNKRDLVSREDMAYWLRFLQGRLGRGVDIIESKFGRVSAQRLTGIAQPHLANIARRSATSPAAAGP